MSSIEKWVAVADICRCLHNYNAVLEITSSLNRSAIFRLKKTWLKVSKQVRRGAEPLPGHRVRPSGGLDVPAAKGAFSKAWLLQCTHVCALL